MMAVDGRFRAALFSFASQALSSAFYSYLRSSVVISVTICFRAQKIRNALVVLERFTAMTWPPAAQDLEGDEDELAC